MKIFNDILYNSIFTLFSRFTWMKFILMPIYFLFQLNCNGQTINKYLEFSIPTIEQEATSIWRTINDIEFLEGQGYQVHFPKNEIIKTLILKSKNKDFGNEDFAAIYDLLESGVYDKSDYKMAMEKLRRQEKLLNTLIQNLIDSKASWNWEFKIFSTYNVVFTQYGTGGSYDPDIGRVTLFTNKQGEFKNYNMPGNTIMHEIVHMGIEKSIVQKYKLSHGLKERIVDIITFLVFKDNLPEYKVQDMGDASIETYINDKKDIKNLNVLVEQYLEDKID